MFEGIVNQAQRSIDTLISKYVTRLVVAVPILVAVCFATAAASVKLSQDYGSLWANMILAGVFCVIALAAAAMISLSGPTPVSVVVDETAEQTAVDRVSVGGLAAPDALLDVLKTIGPAGLIPVIRLLFKNLPVLFAIIAVGYLLFSERSDKPPGNEMAEGKV